MQTIAAKLSRLSPAAKALTLQQRRHLIHGCGGSPRRANKALRHGFAELLADAYAAALEAGAAHVKAVQQCDALWLDLVPRQADAEPADESGADEADDEASEPAAATAKPRAPRFMGKRPSLMPTAAETAAILASVSQPAA